MPLGWCLGNMATTMMIGRRRDSISLAKLKTEQYGRLNMDSVVDRLSWASERKREGSLNNVNCRVDHTSRLCFLD